MAGFPPSGWGRPRLEAFAVEPHAVQLTWVALPVGPLRIVIGDTERFADSDGGPGGLVVDDLTPGRGYDVRVEGPGSPRTLRVQTPASPVGSELFRLATVSDVHIGADHFGLSKRMHERMAPAVPHPERCGRAALAEAHAWGAQFVVVKGDLVERGEADEWAVADRMLAHVGLPAAFVPGNHEVKSSRPMDPPSPLPASGVEIVDHVVHHDLPGVRLVLVNSTVDGEGHGAVDHLIDEVATLAAEAEHGVLVAMHQHPQRFETPWFWPPGIPGKEGRRLLDALAVANPNALITSGHTHRNRSRRHGPIVVTEVGSTKDFPGVWAGYTVYEGGITQTVRRTLSPDAMAWTEYTRRAVLGVWGRWSPGTLVDRCVVMDW